MELLQKHGGKLISAYLLGFLMLSAINIILMSEKIVLLFMMVPPLSALIILSVYLLYFGGAAEITISAAYKDNSSISLFFKGVIRNFWKLFKIHMLIVLIAAIPVTLIFTLGSWGSFIHTQLFGIFDMIFSLFLYLFIIYLSFFGSILVIKDQLKAWPAVKKSFKALKSAFKKILIALFYTVGTQLFIGLSLTGVILIIVILFNLDQINNQDLIIQLTYLGGMIFQAIFSLALVCGLPVFIKKYKDMIEPHLSLNPTASGTSESD